jgi:hypothetical protein
MAQSQQKMGGKRWFCGWYKEVMANLRDECEPGISVTTN